MTLSAQRIEPRRRCAPAIHPGRKPCSARPRLCGVDHRTHRFRPHLCQPAHQHESERSTTMTHTYRLGAQLQAMAIEPSTSTASAHTASPALSPRSPRCPVTASSTTAARSSLLPAAPTPDLSLPPPQPRPSTAVSLIRTLRTSAADSSTRLAPSRRPRTGGAAVPTRGLHPRRATGSASPLSAPPSTTSHTTGSPVVIRAPLTGCCAAGRRTTICTTSQSDVDIDTALQHVTILESRALSIA